MPQPKSRYVTQQTPHPLGFDQKFTISVFSSQWWSNRENGQIVKRESPWSLVDAHYTRLPKGIVNHDIDSTGLWGNHSGWNPTSSPAYAKAYRRFQKEAERPSAELLLNVVEGRKSLEMIASRAHQLSGFVRSVRKGRLGDAWLYMSQNPTQTLAGLRGGRKSDWGPQSKRARLASEDAARRKRILVKDIASLLLEIRYGWQPLIADIQSACEVLTKPMPDLPIKARGSSSYSTDQPDGSGGSYKIHCSDRVTVKGRLRVTNPNLHLAAQMGLLNPLSLLWESIPFSFVFDWFLSVGKFLGNLTDSLGLELIDGSITGKHTATVPDCAWTEYAWANPEHSDTRVTRRKTGCSMLLKKIVRTVGMSSLPKPPLEIGTGLSVLRAQNAVALLLQLLNPDAAAKSRRA
nr:MAG: maturation protein [Leviviridae sp.]